MARKSRKNLANEAPATVIEVVEKEDALLTAAYARLSVEKSDKESIQTQVLMLHNFISEHPDLQLYETYIDDGYTGTSFDRPDFTRLMDDVRTGKIQCIVVKDLSRFGRDFLETGYYIETLLPRLNVRLIAVTDDFDSSREEDVNSISVPIKNMVNELYAKDISRKVSSYHELHRQRGDVRLTRTVYGFSIDREHNVYVPNPETAPVVRVIFRWFLMGYTTGQIMERLNLIGVMTPGKYKETVDSTPQGNVKDDLWDRGRIRDTLRNQRYVGTLIWGKRATRKYLNIPEHFTPEEEWAVYHNMHEPLIAKEDFEKVQDMLDKTWEKMKKKPIYETDDFDRFPKKVYCAECGRFMSYTKLCYRNQNGAIYYCQDTDANHCHQKIHADFIRVFVSDQIQFLIRAMCDRKKLIEEIKRENDPSGKLFAAKRKSAQLRVEFRKTEERSGKLYEDLAEGIISMSDYQELRQHYAQEKARLQELISKSDQEQRYVEMQIGRFLDWEAKLEQHLGELAFNGQLVDELVEKIIVSSKGSIEIRFTCDDICSYVAELLDGGDEA